ncbi:ankyrin repeat RF_0381 [Olea europaea subsp. europaea]|uniref:Ankyrin repeat RF_0381 n=1 Tax=Olea europaea subsp. europaea TaxID=158383 RepID=A0A8S0S105_OLEEU|nr:ankyrin repeat RF_0381 [Olea europaea subsp. europaea]
MPPTHFPLRWESTGDQWWFASPIDWAAANGHYDLVRELLHLDTNLLVKLSSLRRIRRLESVWDDEEQFDDISKCRSQVAQKLLQECQTKKGHNSLIRAGYGGWLLYTAASAGDVIFVKELLDKDPLLVFGEGEYGVTDIFYAAARSKNSEVFRLMLDYAILRTHNGSSKAENEEVSSAFKREMVNRAVHAAARGGNLEILRELLKEESDVLSYRDGLGSIVLHTASGRGQVQVVKHLLSSFDIINTTDNQGNTALNVAAYRGHLEVVKVLVSASPSCASLTNNFGDTFLHMAVAGFRTPGFRRLDRQIELMKQLVSGKIVNIEDIINVTNSDGRTALHMAVIANIQSDVVELLMSVCYINLNTRDADGNTPLDLLKQRPKSASSEILMKRLISAGGISSCQDQITRSVLASHLRMQGIGGSPGTSFRIPDTEIFLYSGMGNASDVSGDLTSGYASCSGDLNRFDSPAGSSSTSKKKSDSVNNVARRLKILLRWPGKKERKTGITELDDDNSVESYRISSSFKNSPVPLGQKFSRISSLPNNKRVLDQRGNLPSPSTKDKFAAELSHGVMQMMPQSYFGSPSTPFSESSWSSAVSANKEKDMDLDAAGVGLSSVNQSPKIQKTKMKHRPSFNTRLMNHYLCFGAHGLDVDNLNHKKLAV